MVGNVWLERQVCEGNQQAVFLQLCSAAQRPFLQVNLEIKIKKEWKKIITKMWSCKGNIK